jgi:hypothetical protein
MNRVAVIRSILSVDHRVITVYPYCPVVMRDRENKDLSMELLLSSYKSEELSNGLSAIVMLSIGNIS